MLVKLPRRLQTRRLGESTRGLPPPRNGHQSEPTTTINVEISSRDNTYSVLSPPDGSQEANANDRPALLEQAIQDIKDKLTASQRTVDEQKENINSLQSELRSKNDRIAFVERINCDLQLKKHALFRIVSAHEQMRHCEALDAQGRVLEVADSLLEIESAESEDVKADKLLSDWRSKFTQNCITKLEGMVSEASKAENRDVMLLAYFAVLRLNPSTSIETLTRWASEILIDRSVPQVLNAAVKFKTSRFLVYRTVCSVLEADDRVPEAVECFRCMENELPDVTDDEQAKWKRDFRECCTGKLVSLGDNAMDARELEKAIGYYSEAISFRPSDSDDILLKCSNRLIEVDPLSHKGYKWKHAALNAMGHYSEGLGVFKLMLPQLERSSDPNFRNLYRQYLDATSMVQQIVHQTVRPLPQVLIDTVTGRFYNKAQQAAMFRYLPIYDELRSSMMTRTWLDHGRIEDEVKKFYRYVMFSHRWDSEDSEPLFHQVQNITIFELEPTPSNIKLQMLCKTVRHLGFQWVWSDTCCIDRGDNVVLQESLVAMFVWYRDSSLTLVYLRGVWSHSQQPGNLQRSVWNTRAWTYQEYLAAKTVQFYTEDWEPYLGLEMFNHKESPTIIAEMEQPSGVSQQQLSLLRPGLERVREKLSLASTRHGQTTLVEDAAYSLLGIFNAPIPVIYGEGNRAVGRLLEFVLTGSGNVTILAWTGSAGGYNSCLPVDLAVFRQIVPQHIPQPIEIGEMDSLVLALRTSLPDPSLAVTLYERLCKHPPPSMAASRLRLYGITFPILELAHIESETKSGIHVYRATTAALWDVEIKTTYDLSNAEDLILIHPWIDPLLDQEFLRCAADSDGTRALRLVARLRQPFGALLLEPLSRAQYKRVAADDLIMARIREETALTKLIDGIDTVDIQ